MKSFSKFLEQVNFFCLCLSSITFPVSHIQPALIAVLWNFTQKEQALWRFVLPFLCSVKEKVYNHMLRVCVCVCVCECLCVRMDWFLEEPVECSDQIGIFASITAVPDAVIVHFITVIASRLLFSLLPFFPFYLFFIFWLHHEACRILVPRPGIEPTPPAVEVRSLNCWATREVPSEYPCSRKPAMFAALEINDTTMIMYYSVRKW